MSRVQDLLNAIAASEDGYPEGFSSELMAAYDEDMSIPAAKVAELEAVNETLQGQIAQLKAHNYDLLTAVGASPETPEEDDQEETEISIDDLFEDGE